MARNRKKAHRLKVVSDNEINKAWEFQHEHTTWDFYSERELLESVLGQRVNFLITVFALFITAAATVDNTLNLVIVLSSGAFLLLLLTMTIYRVYVRLDIVSKMLYKLEKHHVLPFVQQEIEALKWRASWNMNKLLWVYIPGLCFFLLLFGAIAAGCGLIEPTGVTKSITGN